MSEGRAKQGKAGVDRMVGAKLFVAQSWFWGAARLYGESKVWTSYSWYMGGIGNHPAVVV